MHFALNNVGINITDTIVANNFVKLFGAGLYFEENIRAVNIIKTIFSENYAWGTGGAVYFGTCILA